MGLDCGNDTLNSLVNNDFYDEKDNSIVSKGLKNSIHKNTIDYDTSSKFIGEIFHMTFNNL